MIPKQLLYAETHEWADLEEEGATVGITQFAQEQLGDLTFIDLPQVGQEVRQGEEAGSVESVKAASEIYSPVTGTVTAVNTALEDAPQLVNEDPYVKGWLFKVKLTEEPTGLLDSEAYAALVQSQAH